MKDKRFPLIKKIIFISLGVAFLIAAWYVLAAILKSNGNMVILYPHEAIARAFALMFIEKADKTWLSIGYTFMRVTIGFVISFIFGLILGTIAGLHENFESFMKPIVMVFRTVPTAAVVILLVATIYGPKNAYLITYIPCLLVFLVAFPSIYEAVRSGIRNEDENVINALDLDSGHKSIQSVIKVLWPDIMPNLWMALAQTLGLSLKVCIMSEALSASSASKPSLGGLIVVANQVGDVEDILPYALIALLMMVIIDIPLIILKARNRETAK